MLRCHGTPVGVGGGGTRGALGDAVGTAGAPPPAPSWSEWGLAGDGLGSGLGVLEAFCELHDSPSRGRASIPRGRAGRSRSPSHI